MKDLTILCALILAVVAGSFAGSVIAVYAIRTENAAEMAALRANVEPLICTLLQSTEKN